MRKLETATAEQWYEARDAGDGITLIHEPGIKPFYRCNMWLVPGRDRDLLIDSGMGVVPLREHIPALTGRPVLAVASHTHFDHVGSHHEFDDRAVHAAEADILADPRNELTLADLYAKDDIFDRLPPEWEAHRYRVRPAPATRVLHDGDVVDLGNRVFEVIHLPGHSPGGIALWEENSGILFSGDTVYDGPLIEDAYHSDMIDYIRSMERLRRLPARVVHGGHFPSFTGERYHEIIDRWLREKGVK